MITTHVSQFPRSRVAPQDSQPAGEAALFEVQDSFLRHYDNAMAGYLKTGLYDAKHDSDSEQQAALRTAVQAAIAALSGATARAVATAALSCVDLLHQDPHPDPRWEPYSLQRSGAPTAAVVRAALQTIEELPPQTHPHAQTLARFGRELSQDLEPRDWNDNGYNLENIYACDYAVDLAQSALTEIANLDETRHNPSLGESVARTVLSSMIYGGEQQNLALDEGFQLILEDRNPRVYHPEDRNQAYAGLHTLIKREHDWMPFLKQNDVQMTAMVKTAMMKSILLRHGGEVPRPFGR